MTLPLPPEARAIVGARLRGLKPAAMVIVSLVGPLELDNPVVYARAGHAYDWRWVHGLEVCVFIGEDHGWVALLKDIALPRPAYLGLWHPGARWGAHVYLVPAASDIGQPVRRWAYELDFLPWLEFQNRDFDSNRRYARTGRGMPHAVNH